MAECEWAVFCDYAFLDQQGKMCLIGIFNRIYVKEVPAVHPQASLVLQVLGKPKEAIAIRVELVRPTGATLKKIDGSGEVSEDGGAGLQLRISPVHLPDYGEYDCNIYVTDVLSYTAKFTVSQVPSGGRPS
jgi:hypothetical protein